MRTIATVLLSTIGLTLATPSLARDAASSARDRARVAQELQCDRKTGKGIGNCLRDKLKSLEEGRRQFLKRQDEDMASWKIENASMGRTPEYERALRAKQAELDAAREAYELTITELRRAAEAERQKVRSTAAERPLPQNTATKPTTRASACFSGSRDTQRRCLRNALYPRKATEREDKQDETR